MCEQNYYPPLSFRGQAFEAIIMVEIAKCMAESKNVVDDIVVKRQGIEGARGDGSDEGDNGNGCADQSAALI
jgi:hypothetical protein